MLPNDGKLTGEQRQAVEEAASYLDRAFEEARARLATADVRFDGPRPFCLADGCHCEAWEPNTQPWRIECENCPHPFSRHYVY
ncbi:hypothetical protein [Streptomyces lavendofoliae]|uniref:Uncharacterized protein n=1 Tax=Streptomyces lavendofoliae TaxID=67314 RepID=A0A918M4K1_9ACTN|nr:hypothetical protein [Streptomyces lavendofoliae]GGU39380.1 hypothetical protein GCM10010274_28600 [Streptomyces lavendofoliae]